MRAPYGVLGVLVLAGAIVPIAARAGDGATEERLAGLERRVAALETDMAALRQFLFEARISANEVAAIATLRNVVSAQAQFQAAAVCDEDRDGTGEYGGFAEMSGSAAGRMAKPLALPVLAPPFRTLTDNGEVERAGYLFRIHLPNRSRGGVPEPRVGFSRSSGHDPELSEAVWCAYAWPVRPGATGRRTFFANQAGDVLATEAAAYAGSGAGPRSDAAFRGSNGIAGAAAARGKANDGNAWEPID
jgi:hypothetical protein